jgi:peptidoglycan/xylan/chitin deacetylase (PgdA/CDA1 family)
MTSRRSALVTFAAAGVITLAGCAAPPRRAFSRLTPGPTRPADRPSPSATPPSHALTSGDGPDGSVNVTGSSGVALTFDDGPDPDLTPKILDLLGEHGTKATFSLVGWRARDHPEVVHRMAAEGHTLCNHSWQHLMDLGHRPSSYLHWDLSQTTRAIQTAAPDTPVRYFRAPGGNFTPGLVALVRQYGMTPLSWNVDPRDWDSASYGFGEPMVRHIVGTVQANVRPGRIVLSHDCKHPDTITAYATLLPWLKSRYTLIPLPT